MSKKKSRRSGWRLTIRYRDKTEIPLVRWRTSGEFSSLPDEKESRREEHAMKKKKGQSVLMSRGSLCRCAHVDVMNACSCRASRDTGRQPLDEEKGNFPSVARACRGGESERCRLTLCMQRRRIQREEGESEEKQRLFTTKKHEAAVEMEGSQLES